MAAKVRATTAYDEALAYHGAKDFEKALPLMTEASQLGNAQAMSVLGSMYLLGQGTKEDGRQAEHWLLKSVESGFQDAASVLGMAYATGKAGIKVDIAQATELLTAAANRGDAQSAKMLAMMEKGDGMFASLHRRAMRKG